MKHSELVEIRRDYIPVFRLGVEEHEEHWKSYVPHENFQEFLDKVLNVLEGKSKKNAVWLQGSYGTGKTHACSVVAHLVSENVKNIEDYMERLKAELRHRLKYFREKHRYLPVYMRGTEDAPSLNYVNIYVKGAIKRALQKAGIKEVIEYELDKILEYLPQIVSKKGEEKILKEYTHGKYGSLSAFMEDLKKPSPEPEALEMANSIVEKEEGLHFSFALEEWLEKVNKLLKDKGYSGILLIWDEFTEIIKSESHYLEKLQNLAEKNQIKLIIVSHVGEEELRSVLEEKTLRKIEDRFEKHRLKLEEITAFKILQGAFHIKDYQRIKEAFEKLEGLLRYISRLLDNQKIEREDIMKVYPLHPYTALLCTDIAERFFSATRSMFDFLFGSERVLSAFLEKTVEEEPFLTVDYLWDYFYRVIEEGRREDRLITILSFYNTYANRCRERGEEYLKVFKALMVFNVLYTGMDRPKMFEEPTEENIKKAYAGTSLELKCVEVLRWLEEEDILHKDPDGKYRVDLRSGLPQREIDKEKEALRSKYASISTALKEMDREKLKYSLSLRILREINLNILTHADHPLQKEEDHTLNLFVGFPTTEAERNRYIEKFRELSSSYPKAVFILYEEVFGEKNLERWIDYKARERVAQNHQLNEQRYDYSRYASKMLEDYISKLTYARIFYEGNEERLSRSFLKDKLNIISRRLFAYGPENLKDITNQNLWKTFSSSPKLVDTILQSSSLSSITQSITSRPDNELLNGLKDKQDRYIFDDKFSNTYADPEEHPIVNIYEQIKNLFSQKKEISAKDLSFLKKPPYGLYNNKVSLFMLTIAIKPLQEKLHKVGYGKVDISTLKDFIGQFFGLSRTGNLIRLRLGSEEEEKLTNLLRDIFSNFVSFQEEDKDLIKVRNTIRENIQSKLKRPIWSLAHLDEGTLSRWGIEPQRVKDTIRKLSSFIGSADNYSEEDVSSLYNELDRYKNSYSELFGSIDYYREGMKNLIQQRIKGRDVKVEEVGTLLETRLSTNPIFWKETEVSHEIDRIIGELIEKKQEEKQKIEKVSAPVSSVSMPLTATTHKEPSVEERKQEKTDIHLRLETLSKVELMSLISYLISLYPHLENEVESWLLSKGY